jgi:hypothetical protein
MKNNLLFAEVSEQAYNDTVTLPGFITYNISSGDAQAFLLKSNDLQIVVCRGTEIASVKDLLADSILIPDDGWHMGFKLYADAISENLEWLLDSTIPIVFTGHSLGGAVSTILASRFKNARTTLYTYGSPRVGMRCVQKDLEGVTHYRWARAYDPVPMLPFWPFKHHGKLMFIAPDGSLLECSLWKRWVLRLFGDYEFGNHFVKSYVECIKNL